MTLSITPNTPTSGLTLRIIPELLNKPPIIRKRIAKYTLEIFLERAREIHGNKYDYSNIRPEDIQGRDCHVDVKCNVCGYEWKPSIQSHITHKSNCQRCTNTERWTLNRLLTELRKVHGDQFDYSQVKEDHIKNNESRIPVICNMCGHKWNPDIHSHVRGRKCAGCVNRIPWNLERVLLRFNGVHGGIYDYSEITKEHVQNCNSRVPIRCKTCLNKWHPTIDSHVKGHGCSYCNKSKGEKACAVVLKNMAFDFEPQFRIKALPRRPFDFGFKHNEQEWLLEFDGQQHFHFNDYFHDDLIEFLDRQTADIIKTKAAIAAGYRLIHIDYTQIDLIEYHIQSAINLGQPLYFSTSALYSHYN